MEEGDGIATDHGVPVECQRDVPGWMVFIDNAPTAVLFLLGGGILWMLWWPLSIAYLEYCCISIILFWGLICPHCHHFGTRACPCGYGVAAPKLFRVKDVSGKLCPECGGQGALKVFDAFGSLRFVRCPMCRGLKMLFQIYYE